MAYTIEYNIKRIYGLSTTLYLELLRFFLISFNAEGTTLESKNFEFPDPGKFDLEIIDYVKSSIRKMTPSQNLVLGV